MTNIVDCLDVIGIAREVCDCLPSSENDYSSSISGVYIEDYVSLYMPLKFDDCSGDESRFWQDIAIDYDNAKKSIANQLLLAISQNISDAYTMYKGDFCTDSNFGAMGQYLNQTVSFAISTRNLRGAFLKINAIGILANASNENVVISIKKDGIDFESVAVSVSAYKYKRAIIKDEEAKESPIILPIDGSDYEFSYEATGFSPLRNDMGCSGCGNRGAIYSQFFSDKDLFQKNPMGLIFTIEFACDKYLPICDLANGPEIENIANLIAIESAIKILNRIKGRSYKLKSLTNIRGSLSIPEITNDLLTKREDILGKYRKKMPLFDIPSNSCYSCSHKSRFSSVKRTTI